MNQIYLKENGRQRADKTLRSRIGWGMLNSLICVLIIAVFLPVFGVHLYIVESGSMEPAIHTGSVCLINERIPYEEIEAGDIIAYEAANGMPVTHRVVEVTDDGMETKGDANERSDGISTTKENYMGKNIGSIPLAGYLLFAANTVKQALLP